MMSKIEEIRKRHATKARILDLMGTPDPTHDDRGMLLAALDGEWQSERPTEGDWYMSLPVDVRKGRWEPVEFVHIDDRGSVWSDAPGHDNGFIGYLSNPMFTGALWQRRTVPADPFKRGE